MTEKDKKHIDGARYFNPTLTNKKEAKSFIKGLKMWLSTPKSKWPSYVANTAVPNIQSTVAANDIAVTFINHVTFLLQLTGLNIITDPVWVERTSPIPFLGPKRVRDPGVALADLPHIDLVLISHNHYDHLDIKTLKFLKEQHDPIFLIPVGDSRILNKLGITKYQELDWWDTIPINNEIKITFTPTQHWSARGIFDQYKSLWGSYVIECNDHKIFFGGDGGYCPHYSEINAKFGPFDLSFIGIGAYEPRWFMKNMHTSPEEAVLIHQDLKSKLSVGMHFGTFQLSAESIDQPLIDLKVAKAKHEIAEDKFITLNDGETRIFTFELKDKPWTQTVVSLAVDQLE